MPRIFAPVAIVLVGAAILIARERKKRIVAEMFLEDVLFEEILEEGFAGNEDFEDDAIAAYDPEDDEPQYGNTDEEEEPHVSPFQFFNTPLPSLN